MNAAVETLGQRLKSERERKGLSAQKAADELHLDGWVIDALESGDYARIGPTVYGKGHLKRYAGLLGLPTAEVLAAYDAPGAAPLPAASPSLRLRSVGGSAWALPARTMAVTVAIAVAVVIALAVAGVLWWRPWQSRVALSRAVVDVPLQREASTGSSGPSQTTAAESVAEETAAAAADSSVSGAAQPGAAVQSGVAASNDVHAGTGKARLRLSFSADSWVDVRDAAGRRVFAGYGRANSVKVLGGVAPLQVYLGLVSGVQLEVNNHVVAIAPQFVSGSVARFEAGADGVLRRDAHAVAAGAPRPRG